MPVNVPIRSRWSGNAFVPVRVNAPVARPFLLTPVAVVPAEAKGEQPGQRVAPQKKRARLAICPPNPLPILFKTPSYLARSIQSPQYQAFTIPAQC